MSDLARFAASHRAYRRNVERMNSPNRRAGLLDAIPSREEAQGWIDENLDPGPHPSGPLSPLGELARVSRWPHLIASTVVNAPHAFEDFAAAGARAGRHVQDGGRLADLEFADQASLALGVPAASSTGNALKSLANSRALRAGGTGQMDRKLANMYPPREMPQRPFIDDYPETGDYPAAAGWDAGKPLDRTIDGDPLGASLVAGRRTVGAADEGLSPDEIEAIIARMDIPVGAERRKADMGRAVGRYIYKAGPYRSDGRAIDTVEGLSPTDRDMVLAHELGHAIHHTTDWRDLPQKREMGRVYHELATGTNSRGVSKDIAPTSYGHYKKGHQTNQELVAEALRAYMTNPNYMKTVAPKAAAALRALVNKNPETKQIVQLNSLAGAGLLAHELTGDDE